MMLDDEYPVLDEIILPKCLRTRAVELDFYYESSKQCLFSLPKTTAQKDKASQNIDTIDLPC